MSAEDLTPDRKALLINLDRGFYGTFAEIGAGQEVARHFFQVGAASGSIAKTMSAYDMKFSDAIYGKSDRYVSRSRLESMLNHEYGLLIERLDAVRGDSTKFFVYANTVATRDFKGTREGHGWMGIRFQLAPREEPNDIIIHARLNNRDSTNQQQQVLGIVGVNLIYGAFFSHDDEDELIRLLIDDLSRERVEIDMVEFRGPHFANIDNRVACLKLVQHGLSNAVMFSPDKKVLQPADALYKKPVLVERGSFRPVTHLHTDMINGAMKQFQQHLTSENKDPVVLMELTLSNLLDSGAINLLDFLGRVEMLSSLGYIVMVSNYPEFYRLTSYLRTLTKEPLGVVLGINTLLQIFDEQYYENLEGGILESFGRMFRYGVRLFVYPMKRDTFEFYVKTLSGSLGSVGVPDDAITDADNLRVPNHLRLLYRYLLEAGLVVSIKDYDMAHIGIIPRKIPEMILKGDNSWEQMVPDKVRDIMRSRMKVQF